MKTRNYYLLGAFGLLVVMMYLFTSQNRVIDIEKHLEAAKKYEQGVSDNPGVVKIENEKERTAVLSFTDMETAKRVRDSFQNVSYKGKKLKMMVLEKEKEKENEVSTRETTDVVFRVILSKTT